jgi:uncharacterized protein
MAVETAERALDYFMKRTKDNKKLAVSFYGGEPLLNLNLVKHCINYIETRYYGKKIYYTITTNGTLLDDRAIAFLADKEFELLISLDGPQEIHDARRKFANNEGSYAKIMDNVARIKRLYPEYYQTNVRFNAVLDTGQKFGRVNDFVSGDELLGADKFMLHYAVDDYAGNSFDVDDDFFAERAYELFKHFLAKLGEISAEKVSHLFDERVYEIYSCCFQNTEIEHERIPARFHHSGPCIPGVHRLFVDADGRFYPCERVSELSETALIGDIEKGVMLEQVSRIINPEVSTQTSCRYCWAYRKCTICLAEADDMQDISATETGKRCPRVRSSAEDLLKDYCVLRELGYAFDEEARREADDV